MKPLNILLGLIIFFLIGLFAMNETKPAMASAMQIAMTNTKGATLTSVKASVQTAATTATKQSAKRTYIAIGVNDQVIPFYDAKPYIENSTAYVPIRRIGEALGGKVTYDSKTSSAVFTYNQRTMRFYIHKNEISIESISGTENGVIPATIFEIDGRTYVPLRLFGEKLGFRVDYLSGKGTVRLLDNPKHLSHNEFITKNSTSIVIERKEPKTAYLTFDDGPSRYTGQFISALSKYDIKATFFQIGLNVKEYPKASKAEAQAGHYIGIHSYSHDKSKVYYSPASFMNEITVTQNLIKQNAGFNTQLVRVPYGSKPYLTGDYRNVLAAEHYKLWDWNVDSDDWALGDNTTQIMANIKNGVARMQRINSKEPLVILMHEKEATAKILPQLIEYLHNQGYSLEKYAPGKNVEMNFWNDKRF
ncbi:polysaccharide deacetylase family protein [Falsibacillus pallidus]|uniref:Peptidoglycan/xylan/chitin deacetylase (PgdA/CDA1 family) n=1 Tax=Falsibacillus pallidus TaxID=493781 RepID=A0A370GCX0_9BACI|nr:polysaccharide deacetylase family protein [Falsibacillus pallidus]RDI41638.1 peptidoglycan/xylan/chitin deacetylase (PgdA/CDA1 family) [Falsibacillus pallidus]